MPWGGTPLYYNYTTTTTATTTTTTTTTATATNNNNNNNNKTEYISRHNNAAAYFHWSICKDHDREITDKWYEHEPETVMHNKDNNITIMWDMPVNTDRTITANRPDIIVKDSVNSTCCLII